MGHHNPVAASSAALMVRVATEDRGPMSRFVRRPARRTSWRSARSPPRPERKTSCLINFMVISEPTSLVAFLDHQAERNLALAPDIVTCDQFEAQDFSAIAHKAHALPDDFLPLVAQRRAFARVDDRRQSAIDQRPTFLHRPAQFRPRLRQQRLPVDHKMGCCPLTTATWLRSSYIP